MKELLKVIVASLLMVWLMQAAIIQQENWIDENCTGLTGYDYGACVVNY